MTTLVELLLHSHTTSFEIDWQKRTHLFSLYIQLSGFVNICFFDIASPSSRLCVLSRSLMLSCLVTCMSLKRRSCPFPPLLGWNPMSLGSSIVGSFSDMPVLWAQPYSRALASSKPSASSWVYSCWVCCYGVSPLYLSVPSTSNQPTTHT